MEKLSICIPTYKRLDYVKSLVEVIPEKYHVYVSDNGDFIKDGFFKRKNVHIRHIEQVVDMFANWNNAIQMVDTEWFIIPGDDDVVFPNKLEMVERYIDQYSNCAYISFGYDLINENGIIIGGWIPKETRCFDKIDGFKKIMYEVPYRCPSIVINKSRAIDVGCFDERFNFTASDSLFLQKLALKYPIVEVNETIGQYRIWEGSGTDKLIFSKKWFDQLYLWQDIISSEIEKQGIGGINLKKMRDIIIFNNLNYALYKNHSVCRTKRLAFVASVGWPQRIGLNNHLRLFKCLFC